MRMMTGALLILASSMMLAGYEISRPMEVGAAGPEWMRLYGIGLAVVGWVFMLWGFWHDLEAERWRRRRHQRKGDS